MQKRAAARLALVAATAVLVATCGDDDPMAPAVTGDYSVTYAFDATLSGATNSGSCDGSLNVGTQSGSSFSGTFVVEFGVCAGGDGSFTGTVRANGTLTIAGLFEGWLENEADAAGISCTISGDPTLHGTFSDAQLRATVLDIAADCGAVDFVLTLEVTGIPE